MTFTGWSIGGPETHFPAFAGAGSGLEQGRDREEAERVSGGIHGHVRLGALVRRAPERDPGTIRRDREDPALGRGGLPGEDAPGGELEHRHGATLTAGGEPPAARLERDRVDHVEVRLQDDLLARAREIVE